MSIRTQGQGGMRDRLFCLSLARGCVTCWSLKFEGVFESKEKEKQKVGLHRQRKGSKDQGRRAEGGVQRGGDANKAQDRSECRSLCPISWIECLGRLLMCIATVSRLSKQLTFAMVGDDVDELPMPNAAPFKNPALEMKPCLLKLPFCWFLSPLPLPSSGSDGKAHWNGRGLLAGDDFAFLPRLDGVLDILLMTAFPKWLKRNEP